MTDETPANDAATDDAANPSEDSSTAEATSAAESDGEVNEAAGVRSADDTAERPEIQAEQASPAVAAAPAAAAKVPLKAKPATPEAKRLSSIHNLMVEKELLILSYTNEKIPKPYYDRWKREANEIFQLLVRTRNRRDIERKGRAG